MKITTLLMSLSFLAGTSVAQAQVSGCISTPGGRLCVGDNGRGDRGGDRGGGWDRGDHGDRGGGHGGGPGWGHGPGGGHGGGGNPYPPQPPPQPQPPMPYPPNPYPPTPYPPAPQPGPGYGDRLVEKTIYINRLVAPARFSVIGLMGYQDQRELDGAALESVIVSVAQTNGAALGLFVNGYQEDRQATYNQANVMLRSARQIVLGAQTYLDLQPESQMYISAITVRARVRGGGTYPGPGYGVIELRLPVNRQFGFPTQVQLMRDLNLYQYNGARVVEVVFHGRSIGTAYGSVLLLSNGINIAQLSVDMSGREYRFQMTGTSILGQDIRDLAMEVSGMQLDDVVVRVAR